MKRILLPMLLCPLLWLTACHTTTTLESRTSEEPGRADASRRAMVNTELAAEYYRLGNYKPAMDAAQSAISAAPNYSPAYNVLGLIQMSLGQDDKAQAAFEQALRASPNDSEALNNFGSFLCQRKDSKRAMDYFQQALNNPLYQTPERALYNAGICSKKLGDNSGAEQFFRSAVQRQPQFAPPYYELADIEYQRGRAKEAETRMQSYMGMVGAPSAEALYLAARIARANGDKSAEVNYALQLRRRFPEAPQNKLLTER